MTSIVLDGETLATADVVSVARDFVPISIASDVYERLARSRRVVESAAASDESVYGINTGFGKLASVKIQPEELTRLQRNLILSHASGLGDPLPVEVVRAIMLLRVNGLLKTTSGTRPSVPERLAVMLNEGVHPVVPEQGSVGASGDLAALAHVGLGLIGEGEVDVVRMENGGVIESQRRAAAVALADLGIEPVEFAAKEGLAFINGTQAQTAVLALAVHDADYLWRNAHVAAAMSLEALQGTPNAFDSRLQDARPHPGQIASAALLRELLEGSEIRESHRVNDTRVQDPYSLRCTPQILGPVREVIDHATATAQVEINAATDNPLIFGDDLVAGGNFHGQPIAMTLDFLTIAMTTMAGIAERRLERILNPDLSPGLPAFLAPVPGLQSGYMMVQIAAAALVGECRVLCNPASVQSIPTDANQEDYVPMGMAAAMKARRVLDNARRVVACELVCAAQGMEAHRPLRSTPLLEAALAKIRSLVQPLTEDRPVRADIETLAALLTREVLA